MTKQPQLPVYRNYQSDPSNVLDSKPKIPLYKRRPFWLALIGLLALLLIINGAVRWQLKDDSKKSQVKSPTSSSAGGFNKQQYSLSSPNSLWVVVNKQRSLDPAKYAPTDLVTPNVSLRLNAAQPEMKMRSPAAKALEQLFSAASEAGLKLRLSSGYRSYDEQVSLYNLYAKQQGAAQANRESAHPGHSEHQTGLAVDVSDTSGKCVVQQCFANLPEGQWVAANAYKYGFVLRYQVGKENITGYEYEPWHIRYVGNSLAAQLQKTGQTMEEFFNLPHVPLDS